MIANDRHLKLSELIGGIDARRQHGNLSSALRLFVLEYYRGKAAEKLGGETLRATRASTFLNGTYTTSSNSAHAFQASQLFANCALASSRVATRPARAIWPVAVTDQNQRRVFGAATCRVDAADCPFAAEDRVVRSILVDPGAEASGAHA